MSGGLNSLAAVTLEDFVKVFYNSNLEESKATRGPNHLLFWWQFFHLAGALIEYFL